MLLLFFLLSVSVCDGLQLQNKDLGKQVRGCVENTIRRILTDDDLLYVVHEGQNDLLPTSLSNPMMFFDVRKQKITVNLVENSLYPPNYVFFLDDYDIVNRFLYYFHYNVTKFTYFPIKSKVIYVIPNAMPYMKKITLKLSFLKYLVVIAYDENETSVHSSQLVGCVRSGYYLTELIAHGCSSKEPIHFKDARFDNCNLQYRMKQDINLIKDFREEFNISHYLLSEIAQHLKMKISHRIRSPFAVIQMDRRYYKYSIVTKSFLEMDYIWTVPPPKRIPTIEVLKLVFRKEMWIFVGLAFVCTSLAWWMLNKLMKSEHEIGFMLTTLRVVCITILGSTDLVPVHSPLRLLFMAYVVYAIHVQTAFTSNLVNLLTVPQFEPKIQNLEELRNSKIEVVALSNLIDELRETNESFVKYREIQESIMAVNLTALANSTFYLERSLFILEDSIKFESRHWNRTIHFFKDSTLIGKRNVVYNPTDFQNFVNVFNRMVTTFVECGLIDKKRKAIQHGLKNHDKLLNHVDLGDGGPIVITLSHVFVIFLVWTIGIVLAILTFAGEHAVFYYKRKYQR